MQRLGCAVHEAVVRVRAAAPLPSNSTLTVGLQLVTPAGAARTAGQQAMQPKVNAKSLDFSRHEQASTTTDEQSSVRFKRRSSKLLGAPAKTAAATHP